MFEIVTEKKEHIVEYKDMIRITLIPNTKEEHQELIKDNTSSHKVKVGIGQKFKYEERTDLLELLVDEIDTQVKDWEVIKGQSKKVKSLPPCNSETKRAVATRKENEDFLSFYPERDSRNRARPGG